MGGHKPFVSDVRSIVHFASFAELGHPGGAHESQPGVSSPWFDGVGVRQVQAKQRKATLDVESTNETSYKGKWQADSKHLTMLSHQAFNPVLNVVITDTSSYSLATTWQPHSVHKNSQHEPEHFILGGRSADRSYKPGVPNPPPQATVNPSLEKAGHSQA